MKSNKSLGKALAKIIGSLFAFAAILIGVQHCTSIEVVTKDDRIFDEIQRDQAAREAQAERAIMAEREKLSTLGAVPFNRINVPLEPKGDRKLWVPQSAYPKEALKAGIQGVVGYTLSVDANGIPTKCQVMSSSGNAELDAATCHNLMKRAMFHPAVRNGKAVPSSYSSRVRWTSPSFS